MLFQDYEIRPPLLGLVNLDHPLAQGIRMLLVFDEGAGLPHHRVPPYVQNLTQADSAYLIIAAGVNTPKWGIGPYGVHSLHDTVTSYWTAGNVLNWLPTTSCTVAVIRRKTDTTLRASALFGPPQAGGEQMGAHVPYSDGTVYWDFGASSGANRLTKAGLTFTTTLEKWVFVAGTKGSSFYRDGLLLASQSTALTRSAGTTDYCYIGAGNAVNGDLEELYFFGVWEREWGQSEVNAWTDDPYGLCRWDQHLGRRMYSMPSPLPVGVAAILQQQGGEGYVGEQYV